MAGGYNNLSPSQNWQSLGGGGLAGYNNQGGAGTPVARDTMDSLRIGIGRVPSAEYPDGYLGTIRSRRDDRLLDSIKSRVNQKAYQRGVHKGERIEPSMYYWPEQVHPMMGIERQFKAQAIVNPINGAVTYQSMRSAPQVNLTPAPHLVNDGKANTQADQPGQIDARRRDMMAYLKPAWS
jgi:hypothetical protein